MTVNGFYNAGAGTTVSNSAVYNSFGSQTGLFDIAPTQLLTDQQLCKRATALSGKIFLFIDQRAKAQPPFDPPAEKAKWDAAARRQAEYGEETVRLYTSQYSASVIVLLKEFKARGLEDGLLDRHAVVPINDYGVQDVANKLKVFASQLSIQNKQSK